MKSKPEIFAKLLKWVSRVWSAALSKLLAPQNKRKSTLIFCIFSQSLGWSNIKTLPQM